MAIFFKKEDLMKYDPILRINHTLLKEDDGIVFKVDHCLYCYDIMNVGTSLFLWNNNTALQHIGIFTAIGIDKINKYLMCNYFYGYPSRPGVFPMCHYNDFPALTRIVIGIYDVIEAYNMGVRICLK